MWGFCGENCLKSAKVWKKMDSLPAAPGLLVWTSGFYYCFFTSLTGLLMLIFRETTSMGTLLAVHLGVVVGLFVMMPYSKFIHAIFRYAALVRNAIEKSREEN